MIDVRCGVLGFVGWLDVNVFNRKMRCDVIVDSGFPYSKVSNPFVVLFESIDAQIIRKCLVGLCSSNPRVPNPLYIHAPAPDLTHLSTHKSALHTARK